MKKLLLLLFFLSTSASAVPLGDTLGLDPFEDWKDLETEHFHIYHPSRIQDVAKEASLYLEEAHQTLSPLFQWEPRTKIFVLLLDNSDSANGSAAAALRFGMTLFATPPENWSSISHYDNWLRSLIFHEYTHILNMDPTTSFYSWLKVFFGDAIRPNTLWTRWMLEGLAVYMETATSTGGRGRSPYTEMLLRTAVLDQKLDDSDFVTLDKMSGSILEFPAGQVPYLIGYQLMNQAVKNNPQGAALLGKLSYESAGRIPFFVNGNLENVVGKDWITVWDEWVKDTRTRMNEQISKIKNQAVTQYEPVDLQTENENLNALGSRVSPDGNWLAYFMSSASEVRGLFLRNLKTGETKRITENSRGTTAQFTSDSRYLIFSGLNRVSKYNQYSDLFLYDIQEDSHTCLTHGKRAKDPDLYSLTPNQAMITYTVTDALNTHLETASLNLGDKPQLSDQKIIFKPKNGDVISTPIFSKDGKKIIFTMHEKGFVSENLYEINLSSQKITTLIKDGSFNRYPTLDTNGNLYFVSNQSGVDNLYEYKNGKKLMRSNFLTGIAFPRFAPNGELYSNVFTLKGWNLSQIKLQTQTYVASNSQVPPPVVPKNIPQNTPKEVSSSEEDYSIFPSIWPRAWSPIFLFDSSRGQTTFYFGGGMYGFDATHRHEYTIAGAYDTFFKEFDYAFTYATRIFGPTLSLVSTSTVTNTSAPTQTLSGTQTTYNKEQTVGAVLSYAFQGTWSTFTPSLSFSFEKTTSHAKLNDTTTERAKAIVPTATLEFVYSTTDTPSSAIVPEKGRKIRIGAKDYFFRNEPSVIKGLVSYEEYLKLFDHTVLIPSLSFSTATPLSTSSTGLVRLQSDTSLFSFSRGSNYTRLVLRGYPGIAFLSQTAGVVGSEIHFPIWRIFRGWSTHPLFLEELTGYVFGEAGIIKGNSSVVTAPAIGAGTQFSASILNLPLVLSLEYSRGLNVNLGGDGELLFKVALGNLLAF